MKVFSLLLVALLLAACDGGLTLAVTDAPVDGASAVTVQFAGVELERVNGEVEEFRFTPPRAINLLALENGTRALLLDNVSVEEDDYVAIRLKINANGLDNTSSIRLADNTQRLLRHTEEDESTIRIARNFTIERGETRSFTVDFDLRRSIVRSDPDVVSEPYTFAPVVALTEDGETGTLAGTVPASLIGVDCVPAVYLYSGRDVEPDDLGGAGPPVNSARVDGSLQYRFGTLLPGPYTAAFTCEADDDEPDEDEVLIFPAVDADVTVARGQTIAADFGI